MLNYFIKKSLQFERGLVLQTLVTKLTSVQAELGSFWPITELLLPPNVRILHQSAPSSSQSEGTASSDKIFDFHPSCQSIFLILLRTIRTPAPRSRTHPPTQSRPSSGSLISSSQARIHFPRFALQPVTHGLRAVEGKKAEG